MLKDFICKDVFFGCDSVGKAGKVGRGQGGEVVEFLSTKEKMFVCSLSQLFSEKVRENFPNSSK